MARFVGGGGRDSGLGGAKGFPCLEGTSGGRSGLRLKIGLDPGDGCLIGLSDDGPVGILFPGPM